MAGRSILSIDDLSKDELLAMLKLAADLKATGQHDKSKLQRVMDGQNLSMIFQKRSTRTRLSSEAGMSYLGGNSIFLASDDIQLGVNESLLDTARVISRFSTIILARVFGHSDVTELAQEATVPVINALSDMYHPLQCLADYQTIHEKFGRFEGLTLSWVGDGNNVLHDLMLAAPKLGVNLQLGIPTDYKADAGVVARTEELAAQYGTTVLHTTDPVEAVSGAHIVVTDTWISMGQEEESAKRLRDFDGYEVNKELMSHAASDAIFMHCLPRHPEEVSDAVFYSDQSVVFDEAENRMWTVMAVFIALLGK
jgi:ornithine carbamoyltransferase